MAFEGNRRRTILREIRTSLGLTQRVAAEKMGVPWQRYAMFERRSSYVPAPQQEKIAAFYKAANVNELFNEEGFARLYNSPVLQKYGAGVKDVDDAEAPVTITEIPVDGEAESTTL